MSKLGVMITAASALMFSSGHAVPAQAKAREIVLVHGALVDGSGWRPVYDILTKEGFRVSIVQQPLTSLEDDVAATKRVLDLQKGPVVLVGQSYGGTVITVAGNDPKVRALVYVAALQPDSGESSAQLTGSMPAAPAAGHIRPAGAYVYLDRAKFADVVGADLPKATAAFMADSQVLVSPAIFAGKVTAAAWRRKPSYAIVATQDRSINPDLERFMYKRAGAKVTEIVASHAVYISHARAVANVIMEAARKVR